MNLIMMFFNFDFVVYEILPLNRRVFVYTFCLINIWLSLSDDAHKIKNLNIERA